MGHDDSTVGTDAPTKAELLVHIDRAWSALQDAIAGADDPQLVATGPDGWSVKDHLAHLAAWQQSLLALLEGRPRHAAMGIDTPTWETGDEAAINAALYEHHRDRPLPDVLEFSRRSHEQVLAALAPLTDLDLLRPYSHYQPDDPPFNPDPVVGWIAGNTYEHVEEHLAVIHRLLATYPAPDPNGR